jgi:hypothetical protein
MNRWIALSCDLEQEIILFAGRFRKSRRVIHFSEGMDARIFAWESELDFYAKKERRADPKSALT